MLKKPKKQKRYGHLRPAENYPSNSLYNWELFSKKKFKIRQKAFLLIIEDHIRNYDMFWAVNDFVNYDNDKRDNIFRTEEKLNGISALFVLGMIDNEDHQDNLMEVVYTIVNETRGTTLSIKERAEMVEISIRVRILHL